MLYTVVSYYGSLTVLYSATNAY